MSTKEKLTITINSRSYYCNKDIVCKNSPYFANKQHIQEHVFTLQEKIPTELIESIIAIINGGNVKDYIENISMVEKCQLLQLARVLYADTPIVNFIKKCIHDSILRIIGLKIPNQAGYRIDKFIYSHIHKIDKTFSVYHDTEVKGTTTPEKTILGPHVQIDLSLLHDNETGKIALNPDIAYLRVIGANSNPIKLSDSVYERMQSEFPNIIDFVKYIFTS